MHVSEPLQAVLERILRRRLSDGSSPEQIALAEEALTLEIQAQSDPPLMPPNVRQGVSVCGLYGAGDGWVYCSDCVPKPITGPAALARGIYALEPWEAQMGACCDRCGKPGA